MASALVAAEPGDAQALLLQARAFAGADRTSDTIAAARACQVAAPMWDAPVRLEARSLLDANQAGYALDAARRAIALGPGEAANFSVLSFIAQAAGQVTLADWAAAEARRLAPAWPEAFNVSGVVALKRRAYVEAEGWFRQSLALQPDNAKVLNNLALALRKQGRTKEAVDLFERSIGSDPR